MVFTEDRAGLFRKAEFPVLPPDPDPAGAVGRQHGRDRGLLNKFPREPAALIGGHLPGQVDIPRRADRRDDDAPLAPLETRLFFRAGYTDQRQQPPYQAAADITGAV